MTVNLRAVVGGVLCSAVLGPIVCTPASGQEQTPNAPPAIRPRSTRPAEAEFPKTYGPLDASREAYQRADQKRREAIDRQMQTVEDMVWYSGVLRPYRYPPGVGTIYAFGRRRGIPRAWRYPYWYAYPPYPIFEPWPLVPGDIYGYPYLNRVEQPLGHKVIETGPNGYIYRPVYESDSESKQQPTLAPPRAEKSPSTPETVPTPPAVRQSAVERVIPPRAETGPREF